MSAEEYKKILRKLHVDPLCNLQRGARDIYCVVKRSFNLKQSTGGDRDWKITLYIADPTYSGTDISILMFHQDRQVFDSFKENSILVLKGAGVKLYNDKKQIIVNSNRKLALFKPTSDHPEELSFQECPLDGDDHKIVRFLQKWNTESMSNATPSKSIHPRGRQCLEVENILNDKGLYMDFVGQVVDVLPRDNRCVEILLTDYTKNPHPDDNLEERDNLNVGLNYLILCGLWDENIRHCPELKPLDYVSLSNCKKKNRNSLELNIHGDKENKQRVTVLEADDPRLEKLIARQMSHPVLQAKKRRKLSFQSYALGSDIRINIDKSTNIKDILNEREVDKSYKILAYIKDYRPRNIKDWVRGWCSTCNISSSPDLNCTQCDGPTEMIFKFALLVNDGSGAELTLYGFGFESKILFDGIKPEEAHKKEEVFEKLERIIEHACNDEKQYFDLALKPYLVEEQNYFNYQIVETQFILQSN